MMAAPRRLVSDAAREAITGWLNDGAASSAAPPIAVIAKNKTEEIRVELSEFHGHDLVNLRIWADPRDGGAERIPTKAGICCRVALLPELIEALRQAEAEARRAGLL
jgi:hypothetical protein